MSTGIFRFLLEFISCVSFFSAHFWINMFVFIITDCRTGRFTTQSLVGTNTLTPIQSTENCSRKYEVWCSNTDSAFFLHRNGIELMSGEIPRYKHSIAIHWNKMNDNCVCRKAFMNRLKGCMLCVKELNDASIVQQQLNDNKNERKMQ